MSRFKGRRRRRPIQSWLYARSRLSWGSFPTFLLLYTLFLVSVPASSWAQEVAPPPLSAPEALRQAQQYFERARTLAQQGDLDGALVQAEEAARLAPNVPAVHLLIGIIRVQKGEAAPARSAFEKVLQLDPKNATALYQLGFLAESEGAVGEAVGRYRKVLEVAPQSPEAKSADKRLSQIGRDPETAVKARAHSDEATKYIKQHELDAAIGELSEFLQLVPDSIGARYLIALLHARRGRLQFSFVMLKDVVRRDSTYYPAHFLLGTLYDATGQVEAAAEEYLATAEQAKEGPEFQYARSRLRALVPVLQELEGLKQVKGFREEQEHFGNGLAAFQRQEFDTAIAEISEAIRHNPNNPFYHFNLGLAYVSKLQILQAEDAFARALELKPDHALSHFWMGVILQTRGDTLQAEGIARDVAVEEYRKASDEYRKAVEFAGEEWVTDEARLRIQEMDKIVQSLPEASGHFIVGLVLFERGEVEAAIREMEITASLAPKDPLPLHNLGIIYERQGKEPEAIAAYQLALRRNPDSVDSVIRLANLFERKKEAPDAINQYRKAVSLRPNLPDLHYHLGLMYASVGDAGEAIASYQKAIALAPDRPEFRFDLAFAYARTSRYQEALEEYQRTIQLATRPEQEDLRRYAEERIEILQRLSRPVTGSWTHGFFNYDTNATQGTRPNPGIFSSFSSNVEYMLRRKERYTVPLRLSTDNTFFLDVQSLTSNEAAGVSLNYQLPRRGGGPSYTFEGSLNGTFSLTGEGAGASNWSTSLRVNRSTPGSGVITGSVTHLNLRGIKNPLFNLSRNSYSLGTSRTLSKRARGSLTYALDQNDAVLGIQTYTSHGLSGSYNYSASPKLSYTLGASFTRRIFDQSLFRVVGQGADATLEEVKLRTGLLSLQAGMAYTLRADLTLHVQLSREQNHSNVPLGNLVEDPKRVIEALNSGRFITPSPYSRELFSLSITKAF